MFGFDGSSSSSISVSQPYRRNRVNIDGSRSSISRAQPASMTDARSAQDHTHTQIYTPIAKVSNLTAQPDQRSRSHVPGHMLQDLLPLQEQHLLVIQHHPISKRKAGGIRVVRKASIRGSVSVIVSVSVGREADGREAVGTRVWFARLHCLRFEFLSGWVRVVGFVEVR